MVVGMVEETDDIGEKTTGRVGETRPVVKGPTPG